MAVALAAGKLASSEEVGGHSMSCPWPLPRGPPSQALTVSLHRPLPAPLHLSARLHMCPCESDKELSCPSAGGGGGGVHSAHSLETDAKERGQPSDQCGP